MHLIFGAGEGENSSSCTGVVAATMLARNGRSDGLARARKRPTSSTDGESEASAGALVDGQHAQEPNPQTLRRDEIRRAYRSMSLFEKMAIAMQLHRELTNTFR